MPISHNVNTRIYHYSPQLQLQVFNGVSVLGWQFRQLTVKSLNMANTNTVYHTYCWITLLANKLKTRWSPSIINASTGKMHIWKISILTFEPIILQMSSVPYGPHIK